MTHVETSHVCVQVCSGQHSRGAGVVLVWQVQAVPRGVGSMQVAQQTLADTWVSCQVRGAAYVSSVSLCAKPTRIKLMVC
jgi:hypothetical protein